MSKQDKVYPRTAAQLERQYNFGKFGKNFAEVMGVALDAQTHAYEAEEAVKEWSQRVEDSFGDIYAELNMKVEADENGNLIGKIHIGANQLTIDTDNFTLDESGNVDIEGVIRTKEGGRLGLWDITSKGISGMTDNYLVKISAPSRDSDPVISCASIKNGVVQDTLLYATANGYLYCDSGYFKGEVHATSGSFEGEVHATSGSFEGEIKATNGSFKGTIDATGNITSVNTETNESTTITGGKITTNAGAIGLWNITPSGISRLTDNYYTRLNAPSQDTDYILSVTRYVNGAPYETPLSLSADGVIASRSYDEKRSTIIDAGVITSSGGYRSTIIDAGEITIAGPWEAEYDIQVKFLLMKFKALNNSENGLYAVGQFDDNNPNIIHWTGVTVETIA